MKIKSSRSGYTVLASVILVAAIGSTIAVSLLIGGTSAASTAATVQASAQARQLANACAELAIQQLIISILFVGSGNLTVGQGTCTYTVSQQDLLTSLISVSGTVGTVTRRVELTVVVTPMLGITRWREAP